MNEKDSFLVFRNGTNMCKRAENYTLMFTACLHAKCLGVG